MIDSDSPHLNLKKLSMDADKISTKSGSPDKTFEEKRLSLKSEKFDFLQLNFKMKIKTEMCKNWEVKKYCPFDEKCSFAHGIQDIKGKIHLHQNFKTLPCQSYFQNGFCSYGKRCQYIHSELNIIEKFQEYLLKIYKEKNLPIKLLQRIQNNGYIQRLQQIQLNQFFYEANNICKQNVLQQVKKETVSIQKYNY